MNGGEQIPAKATVQCTGTDKHSFKSHIPGKLGLARCPVDSKPPLVYSINIPLISSLMQSNWHPLRADHDKHWKLLTTYDKNPH